jgi:hypothetical protein
VLGLDAVSQLLVTRVQIYMAPLQTVVKSFEVACSAIRLSHLRLAQTVAHIFHRNIPYFRSITSDSANCFKLPTFL